jgi:cytochrome c-type biogenesis protein CcmE
MTAVSKANRNKFYIAGALFFIAVGLMVISATRATAEFFMTVEEVSESTQELQGQNLRVSGAVLGESIRFEPETGLLHFTIAHITGDDKAIDQAGGLMAVLNQAVNNPDAAKLEVLYSGPRPDMLRDEAQAIVTGSLTEEGDFLAEELLLKCPSKYEEVLPDQAVE